MGRMRATNARMKLSRRDFLVASGATVSATALGLTPAQAAMIHKSSSRKVAEAAIAAAKAAGADFADVRVILRQDRSISTREARVRNIDESASLGFNVRALKDGTWGFAASDVMTVDEAARVAKRAVGVAKACAPFNDSKVELAPEPAHKGQWTTPHKKDAFTVPLEQIVDTLLKANAAGMKHNGVKFASSSLHFIREDKLFLSTDGADLEQSHHRLNPGLRITAVSDKGDFRERSADLPIQSGGYEVVDEIDWNGRAAFAAEEAVAYLSAKSVSAGEKDLILLPSNLWLTLHESVGHPTELDRALGYEANYAGTSFCTVDKLNKLQYGSDLVNLVADRTIDRGLATVAWDDEGVAAQQWDIVRDGKFVGYQTTREQAAWIGEKRSKGCSYTQGWDRVPFQRIPNLHLEAGKASVKKDDLIADTKDGVLVDGRGSWSIDHQRYNFQFTGGSFWEIKNGKVVGRLRDVAYQSNSLDFWRACDGIGDKSTWEMHGTFYDGKGEPPQSNACSHGCPVARFRKVNILNTGSK
jgi:TldD protein